MPRRVPLAVLFPVLLAFTAFAPRLVLAQETCTVATASKGSLSEARELFAANCPGIPRKDCDPLERGGWSCSSEVIGARAPSWTSTPGRSAAPVTPVQTANGVDPDGGLGICSVESPVSLADARARFGSSCPGVEVRDCDPAGSRWMCSSGVIGNNAPGGVGNDDIVIVARDPVPDSVAAPVDSPAPPDVAPDIVPPASTPIGPGDAPEPTDGDADRVVGRLRGGDLVALMYDNCSDRDDGHAIAAGKALIEHFEIASPWVVNGTCGNRVLNRFQADSDAVARAAWGSDFLDANADRDGTIRASADAWASVIAAGSDVWVAEGGPSDVTADILRSIGSRYPSIDRSRVHVIQHSTWNEEQTDAANVTFLKRETDYRRIPNGNFGGNGSADLNTQSTEFTRIARAGPFATEWNAAFAYLDPDCPESRRSETCKLDFSDTVELLYILDETSTQKVDHFALRYLR